LIVPFLTGMADHAELGRPIRQQSGIFRASAAAESVYMPNSAPFTTEDLIAEPITAAAFSAFGKLIEAMPDGAPAGDVDRALDLSSGTPRFYIMALTHRPLTVSRITRHGEATQVLASVGGATWLLAVAPPTPGEAAPDPEAIRAFVIPGDVAVLLSRGTWHAGPYFEPAEVSFFNLELEDTNVVDHETCDLAESFGVTFTLRPGA
jgi:ureidoglycolate lyase